MKLKLDCFHKISVILLSFFFSKSIWSSNAKVIGKAIIVKGTVKIQDPETTQISDLILGKEIVEGVMIQTAASSFAKINFFDQSTLAVGPNSKSIISKYPKKDPGIIQLISGEIRTQVEKNAQQAGETKLYIKTKSAALGVRGTDFTTTYNETNQMTSVVTYSGEVILAPTSLDQNDQLNSYMTLEETILSPKAVTVSQGQYSGANPDMSVAITPVKISVAQFEALKSNTSGASEASQTSKTNFTSITLPGVSASAVQSSGTFSNSSNSNSNSASTIPTNINTNAGGFVDLKTGLYLPPPPGSVFDANTGTLIPSSNVGGFDLKTGTYIPPAGAVFTDQGTFHIINPSAFINPPPAVVISNPVNSGPDNNHSPNNPNPVNVIPTFSVSDRAKDVVDIVKDKVVEQVNNNSIINMMPLNSELEISITAKE